MAGFASHFSVPLKPSAAVASANWKRRPSVAKIEQIAAAAPEAFFPPLSAPTISFRGGGAAGQLSGSG
jgi:hypothetical protein